MKVPYILEEALDKEALHTWETIFAPSKGTKNDKTVEQSLWRRNQTEANKEMSGWTDPSDKARKILYYKHEYDVVDVKDEKHLAVISSFVYFAVTLKADQLAEYKNQVYEGIKKGNWKKEADDKYTNEDLELQINYYKNPHARQREYDTFPEGYETLELMVKSNNYNITNEYDFVWKIAQAGLRKSAKRTNPKYVESIKEFIEFLPCQVETGCGPSYEAGVDPLHTMHEIYSINEPFTKKFIISAKEDTFIRDLIAKPKDSYKKTANFYSKIITAKLTDFYKILGQLYAKGYIAGPILTNNFDGLHLRVGVPEIFIRTYDEVDVLPNYKFHEDARSLLVIGCHADRRGIERRARNAGLKVLYIDPEGWDVDDTFFDYFLESPQEEDLILKTGATNAFLELAKLLKINF